MEFPEDLRYTRDHEWARLDKAAKVVTIGITDYAQDKLGDIVYVELPEEGDQIQTSEPFGSIESVKAVSDLFAPVTGTVTEVNDALMDSPELVNEDAYTEAWMVKVKVKDLGELEHLMTVEEYKQFVSVEDEA